METLQKPHVVLAVDDVEGGSSCHHLQSDDEEQQQRRSSSESGCSSSEIVKEERSRSSVSEMDLECGGVSETKVHLSKVERDCRICHLSLDTTTGNQDSGFPIELGCSCKEDLSVAHRHCAEAWFKIKGNKTCEICGSIARNVVGPNEVELVEQWNEVNEASAAAAVVTAAPSVHSIAETRHFWQGHRFLNFLLACMVFAFVISWLFHFNVPS